MDFKEPDEDLAIKIRKELNEEPDRFAHNLKLLEEWMACQPHLPQNYDKRMLPVYMRGCKHDLEKTKRKLELYFVIKKEAPELFCNRDPNEPETVEAVKTVNIATMPNLTPDGYRVTYISVVTSEVAKFKIDLLMRRGAYIACIRTINEVLFAGDILVYDLKNLTAAHAASFLTPLVRKALVKGPDAYPNRLRQIHLVHVPMIMEKAISIVKTLLKEKIRDRVITHTSMETLRDYIPPTCMPCDYGGTEPPSSQISADSHEYLIKHTDWFKTQEDVKLIGPVPEKYKYIEEYGTGTEGSFRKLAID